MRFGWLVLLLSISACMPVPVSHHRERRICVVPAGVYQQADFEDGGGFPHRSYSLDLRPGDRATAIVGFEGDVGGCAGGIQGSCEVEARDDGSLRLRARVKATHVAGFVMCPANHVEPIALCELPPLAGGETVIDAGRVETSVTLPFASAKEGGCANASAQDPGSTPGG